MEKLEDRLALAPIITPHYEIPNFGDFATIHSDSSGAWSNPDTWSAGRVPTAGDVVVITNGTSVTYDLAASAALDSVVIYAGGLLNFRTDMSTHLLVTNLQVLEGGELRVGTAVNPVAANVTAQIVFRNVALNTTRDPSQFGNGLIGLGKVTMHGAAKVSAVRLAAEPLTGQTTLSLAQPATGWRVGDKLFLPDSKQWATETSAYSPSYEDATIAAISADGLTITLVAPLQFNHPGARDGDGVLDFLPHVANRTRNVVVKSESSAGNRGHVFFTHRADVDVRYVGIVGTGRTLLGATDDTTYDAQGNTTHLGTNQSDRHPVNFAHLYGPAGGQANGYQFTFIGNAVFCGLPTHSVKWGIAIEDSHYGLIQGNYLHNWAGAGLMAKSGNESFNTIEGNFAFRGRGVGGRDGGANPGDEGGAFWFRGPNNYVRDNVAANYTNMSSTGAPNGSEAAYGFKYIQTYLGDLRIPNFAGADTTVAGQYTTRFGNAMPILEFARNEVYGTENGLALWWINAVDVVPQNGGESVIKDFRGWHISRYGLYGYPMSDVTFDGYVIRGDKNVLANRHEFAMGMWFGDYMTNNLIIRGADIQGMRTGIIDPYFSGSPSLIEDSYLRNNVNISVRTPGAPGSGPNGLGRGPKSLTVRNVRFGSTEGWNFGDIPPRNISMEYTTHNGTANLVVSDLVTVYDYNGVAGLNYQVYYNEQHADFIVPQSSGNLVGSPVAGLTNQQNWNQYGVAIAGAVAPSDALTIDGIFGLVSTTLLDPDSTPPTTPTGLVATAVSSSRIDLTWTPSTDNVRVSGYRIYRNGSLIGVSTTPSFASTGLAHSTSYTYTVVAYDPAGNTSAASAPASATTFAPPPSRIIDNGDAGSRLSAGWWRNGGRGYAGDVHVTGKGAGGKFATWRFTGLVSGQYNVWVTYTANSKNATDAPFWIYNGSGAAPVVKVNQRLAPTHLADGAKWRYLKKVNVVNGWAMVKLTNLANGIVVADAVRLVKAPAAAPAAASLPLASRVVEAKPPQVSLRSFLASAAGGAQSSQQSSLTQSSVPVNEAGAPAGQALALDAVLSNSNDLSPESGPLEEALNLLGDLSSEPSASDVDSLFAAGFGV